MLFTHNRVGMFMVLSLCLLSHIISGERACAVNAQTRTASWTYTGSLNTSRESPTATLLLNGKVLVTGGEGTGMSELYDPNTGTWSITGRLNTPRLLFATATLLKNGKVLIVGSIEENVKRTELYDPVMGTWTPTGDLNVARYSHTATLLLDGRVLVAGGGDNDCCLTDTAEIYDPSTGKWSLTGRLNIERGRHTAILLPDGRVLVAGGQNELPALHSCELYDPKTGTWTVTGNLVVDRCFFTLTILPNGSVLAVGGETHDCNVSGGCGFAGVTSTAELYDPRTGIWRPTRDLRAARTYHTATKLPNGNVLVVGGATEGFFDQLPFTEIYNPGTGTWSTSAPLNGPRSFHAAVLLNGKVLIAGGSDTFHSLASAELFDSGEVMPNPIDDEPFFVRQHYLDFLNRDPEPEGFEAWLRFVNDCALNDTECFHQKRLVTSAGFFGSPEFQLKGYFVFRFYRVAFDRLPAFEEITPDMQSVTDQTPEAVFTRKAAFVNSFVQRQEFVNTYSPLSNAAFVSSLLGRYQLDRITTPDPANPNGSLKVVLTGSDLVLALNTGTLTRGQVLRAIADSDEVFGAEFNRAFVAMQYYGYLRRTPEPAGYQDWLNYLNAHPTDFLEMVRGFVDSVEYRARFGQP